MSAHQAERLYSIRGAVTKRKIKAQRGLRSKNTSPKSWYEVLHCSAPECSAKHPQWKVSQP